MLKTMLEIEHSREVSLRVDKKSSHGRAAVALAFNPSRSRRTL